VKAHTTLSASNSESQQGKIFFGLLEEAEHIRLSLIILNRARQNLAEDTTVPASSKKYLDQFIQSTANELRMIANELSPAHPSRSFSSHYQQMKEALTALRRQEGAFHDEETKQQILAYCDALSDRLHRARKLAKSWKHRHQRIAIHLRIPRQTSLRMYNAWAILRANLTLRSATFRHAIRLGITLALATALYRLIPLPIQRGYWIPLTALLVLKPDFTATFARGVARTLGTMLGAVLTTLLVSVFAPGQELLVILDAIAAYLAFSILYANYAIFSVFLTMETVFLLTFVTPQPLMTAAYRAIDTAVGGVLALLMYVVWPTWELPHVWDNIANRLDAARRYFVAVMEAYAHPETYDHLAIHNRRMYARLARSNAEASIQRSLQEPEPHRVDADLAYGLLGAIDSIVQSVLTLEAYLIDNPSRHALPEIAPFTAKVDEALSLLATAIRENRPATLPNLKEALRTLESSEKSGHRGRSEVRTDLRFVLSESKRIIHSINTMQQLLSTKLAKDE